MKVKRWSGDWPIPKAIRLPGCRVRVRVLTGDDLVTLDGCDGASVYSHEKDICTILIDGSMPLPVQRYTLVHELRHVDNELLDIMLEHYPEHVQTKHMAGIKS